MNAKQATLESTLGKEQGERVKQLREITHLSRRAFGQKHGVSPGTLQNIEDGRYSRITPRIAHMLIVAFQAEGINCQSSWLLYGKGPKPSLQFKIADLNIASNAINSGIDLTPEGSLLLQQAMQNEKRFGKNFDFFEAAKKGRYHELTELMNSGADAHLLEGSKLKLYQSDYQTALHLASLHGHLVIAKLLVEKGANVNARNKKCQTPLHLAVYQGHTEIVKFLVKNNADLNAIEDEWDTPLAWASYLGRTDIVKDLIQFGSQLNPQNRYGVTPLHWAADKGFLEIVKVLVKNGADTTIKNVDGETPILIATDKGHVETVKYLLGAK